MKKTTFGSWVFSEDELLALIRRSGLQKSLLRRQIEEEIISIVDPSLQPSDEAMHLFRSQNNLSDDDDKGIHEWLRSRGWDHRDLCLELLRPSALKRFMTQRYGPGLEELYLSKKNQLDTVIYSLIRVKDPGLARELWISLSEGEASFADLASRYSDGPEAKTKGVIGPLPLGKIEPVLSARLQSLRVGQLRPPEFLGEWHVLLRLESLSSARLDQTIRDKLLNEQFEAWISHRVDAILSGETPDPLHFEPDA